MTGPSRSERAETSGARVTSGPGLRAIADPAADSGRRFDRTPPQDIDAEQSVLGGMLLSKDAIADVVEVLRGNDFYRPAHQLIYEAVLDLYGRGEPADAVTVAAELTRGGTIGRVGGHPYLHTLISGVPTAANAGYYAEIVACGGSSRPAPASCRWATAPPRAKAWSVPSTTWWTARRQRSTR
jgi:hypothetical protein